MTNEEILQRCREMDAELAVIRERVERHGVEIDVLQDRLDKVGQVIDRLKAGGREYER